jgi:gamma-glutamylcyclotransferase (GGCT)/AIG2-like uncharacterized protein YtfP
MVDRLFVYGTLRPGSNNSYADLLEKAARHMGRATVSGRLYRVTHYPALAPSQSKEDRVVGDLFEGITAELWQLLDEYEGAEYSREMVGVMTEDGVTREAYVYRSLLPTASLEWIRSGDWNQPDRTPL